MSSDIKKGAIDVIVVILMAAGLLFLIVAIDKISLGAVRLERAVQLSFALDSRGSAMYAFLNSGGEKKNIELLGELYADRPTDTKQIETAAEKLYSSYYMLAIKIPKKDVVLGRTDIDKTLPSVEAEFPVPGAGKGGVVKNRVLIIS